MKAISTILFTLLSSAALAHTGDHQGLWHDHGAMAQALMLIMTLAGCAVFMRRSRANANAQQQVKLKTNNTSKLQD
mgnify:FL=1